MNEERALLHVQHPVLGDAKTRVELLFAVEVEGDARVCDFDGEQNALRVLAVFTRACLDDGEVWLGLVLVIERDGSYGRTR